MTPGRRQHRGFTLMEMLVVLILLSLVTALLFETIGALSASRSRVADIERELRYDANIEAWFAESVQGLFVHYESPVVGTQESVEGMSLSALGDAGPATRRIRWRIDRDTDGIVQLVYEEPGSRSWVFELPDFQAARLAYLDRVGEIHDRWPAEPQTAAPTTGLADLPQRPEAVLLVLTQASGREQSRVVALRTPREPVFRPVSPEDFE